MSVEKPRLLVDGKIFYPTVVRVKINPDGTPVNGESGINQGTVLRWSAFDKTAPEENFFSVVTLYQRQNG
ncbi:hypothetical protein COT64_03560 [Candidatus Shapirobacteria bacterium CG09_land_8_20_14_0_10_39_12]|uniref:Uncharacterized protein n=1 Tax=Candidatus Shapirobacteria bacterium CG09_land_8_20_14_0_10_39_12 TaxID=1974885 RepID=A0A2H0WNN9_9BACT|nr:MAG: hypothetical protein COT64_03560 [Candidatus Shapirobacteria bacterium CG09_land_8_20_14_0_10_39_12]